MSVLDDIILESSGKKTWYACISATTWGSIWGSATSLGIPWGHINRTTAAVAEPSLKEAVIRWIKHNNFIKHVLVEGNTVYVDTDWYDREKTTAVIILQAPEGSTFKGVFSDRNITSPYVQHGGVIFKGGAIAPKSMKTNFAKVTGIKSMETTFEQALRKAGLKVKTMDTGINPTGPINAWKKFNGWESSDMYTEREVRELLDKAFSEGYDNGIDDTLDYIDENYELESDDNFDLMDEYDAYTESKASTKAKNKETFMKNTTPYGDSRKRVDSNYRVHLYNNKGEEHSGTKDADDIKDSVRHSWLKKAIIDGKNRGDNPNSRNALLAAPRKSYNKYRALYDKAVANGKKSWADRDDTKKLLKLESNGFDLMDEYGYYTEGMSKEDKEEIRTLPKDKIRGAVAKAANKWHNKKADEEYRKEDEAKEAGRKKNNSSYGYGVWGNDDYREARQHQLKQRAHERAAKRMDNASRKYN